MERKSVQLIANARSLRRDSTDAEAMLWAELRSGRLNGFRFVRQHPIDRYIADFACRSHGLIVELDGSQHGGSTYDERRSAELNGHGWSVLRFWNDKVLRERRAVCETILAVLDGRLTEACDGAGLIHGLRFAPATPSPVRAALAARPPSPASGRGAEPSSADAVEAFVPEAHP